MFDIVPGQPIQPDNRTFAVRIVQPVLFRGVHHVPGMEVHGISGDEFAAMVGSGRAVRIQNAPPPIEQAQAVPVVEVPEARVIPSGPSARDAVANQPQPPARKRRAK